MGVRSLSSLALQGEQQSSIVSLGASDLILGCMTAMPDELTLHEEGCTALIYLTYNHTDNQRTIVEAGGCECASGRCKVAVGLPCIRTAVFLINIL